MTTANHNNIKFFRELHENPTVAYMRAMIPHSHLQCQDVSRETQMNHL
jgi:hypothetical protein